MRFPNRTEFTRHALKRCKQRHIPKSLVRSIMKNKPIMIGLNEFWDRRHMIKIVYVDQPTKIRLIITVVSIVNKQKELERMEYKWECRLKEVQQMQRRRKGKRENRQSSTVHRLAERRLRYSMTNLFECWSLIWI